MSSVEALSKRNSSDAVILGENPKTDCRLIITCVLNAIFPVFTCYWGHRSANFVGARFEADCHVNADQFLV